MSDTQRDREERQHVIEVLKSWDGYFIGYTSDEVQEALKYAISSIETDLKYDLLHEETSGQADKPTTKTDVPDNNVGEISDCISRKDTIEYLKQVTVTDGITFETGFKQILLDIENMPSILPKTNFNYSPASEWEHDHEILKAYSDGQASIITVLEDIKAEMENLKDNRCFCHHYERGINDCINVLNKHMESEET